MTTYNTGNPIGSTDPRDLYDNAENLDELVNSQDKAEHPDRLGVPRKTWRGMEEEFVDAQADKQQRFNLLLANSGHEYLADYAAGIEITEYNQVLRDAAGELWRAAATTTLPYTTDGTGLPEGGAFVAVGDADIRNDLAAGVGAGKGGLLVAGAVIYVDTIADLQELDAEVGQTIYLTQDGRSGEFVVKAGTPPSDPQKGIYIVLANGNYAERQYQGAVKAAWFGEADAAIAFIEAQTRSEIDNAYFLNELAADKLWAVNRLNAVFEAEFIRRNAGIPAYITVGIEAGKYPGLTDESILVDTDSIVLTNSEDIESLSSSGTGTEDDPYIIKNYRWDNSEDTLRGIILNFSEFVEFQNCEITGYSTDLIQSQSTFTGQATFKNCLLAGPANSSPYYIIHGGGSVIFDQCVFGGGGQGRMGGNNNYKAVNCIINDSVNAWGSTHFAGSTFLIGVVNWYGKCEVSHCVFDSSTIQAYIVPYTYIKDWSIEACDFRGLPRSHIGGNATARHNEGGSIKYCRFGTIREGGKAQIWLSSCDRLDISYCDFEDTPAGYRQCHLASKGSRATNVRNSRVHHCKFTKTSGGNSAGNECLESYPDGENIEFDNNWITECVEDGYEHANQFGGCIVHHCVADNCRGQAVDYYKANDEDGNVTVKDVGGYVSHIYGNCGRQAVILQEVDGVTVHSIFVDNSEGSTGSIVVMNGDAPAGTTPNNIRVIGPLPLRESTGNGIIVQFQGAVGSNNAAIYFEDGKLQIIDPDNILDKSKYVIR